MVVSCIPRLGKFVPSVGISSQEFNVLVEMMPSHMISLSWSMTRTKYYMAQKHMKNKLFFSFFFRLFLSFFISSSAIFIFLQDTIFSTIDIKNIYYTTFEKKTKNRNIYIFLYILFMAHLITFDISDTQIYF